MVGDMQSYEDISTINEWISDGGVCRTAPATPGLVITVNGFKLL